MIQANVAGKHLSFAVCLKDTLEIIADCGIGFETKHARGELGYWCGQPYRGQGFMKEATRALIEYVFSNMDLHRVQACHFPSNPASGRILLAIGMQYEGLLRGYVQKNGLPQDVIYYSILRSDVMNVQ